MGNTIPPPPMTPSDTGIDVEDESAKERGTVLAYLKRWWKTATTIGSVLVAVGAIGSKLWSFGVEVNELRNTIVSNKTEVARIANEMRTAREEYETERDALVEAIRVTRSRDQEVITDLRIAVASLQAAQAVRSGRATYEGGGAVSFAEAPRSARARAEQANSAEEDARAALGRARRRQESAEDDPLAGLEF